MKMHEPRMVSQDEEPRMVKRKPQKKKPPLKRVAPAIQKKNRNFDGSTPAESLISNSEYGALRHKYLMLEEESLALDRDVLKAQGQIKKLEDDKFALLDRLVVLEGLVDPSEQKTLGPLVWKKFMLH